MSDQQIRLEILFDYYKAMKNQIHISEQEDKTKGY